MKIYYLRLVDRPVIGLDPALHIEWKDVKPMLEQHNFLVIASGDANNLSCKDVKYGGAANEVHVFNSTIKKWVIFPVSPSYMFSEATRKGSVPIKAAITKYQNGRKTKWKIATLMAHPKKDCVHTFLNEQFSLAAKAWDNPTFEDDDKIRIAMENAVVRAGRKGRVNKRITAVEKLPLPTEIPEQI